MKVKPTVNKEKLVEKTISVSKKIPVQKKRENPPLLGNANSLMSLIESDIKQRTSSKPFIKKKDATHPLPEQQSPANQKISSSILASSPSPQQLDQKQDTVEDSLEQYEEDLFSW